MLRCIGKHIIWLSFSAGCLQVGSTQEHAQPTAGSDAGERFLLILLVCDACMMVTGPILPGTPGFCSCPSSFSLAMPLDEQPARIKICSHCYTSPKPSCLGKPSTGTALQPHSIKDDVSCLAGAMGVNTKAACPNKGLPPTYSSPMSRAAALNSARHCLSKGYSLSKENRIRPAVCNHTHRVLVIFDYCPLSEQ